MERPRRATVAATTRRMIVVLACAAVACDRHAEPNRDRPQVEQRLLNASPEERRVLRLKTRYWNWLDGIMFAAWPPHLYIGPTDLPTFSVLIDGSERRYGAAVIEHVFVPKGYGARPLSRRAVLAWPVDSSADEAIEAITEKPGSRIHHHPPASPDRNIVLDLRPPTASVHFSPIGLSELDPNITKAVGRVAIAGGVSVEPVRLGEACGFDPAPRGDRYSWGYSTSCTRVDYDVAVSATIAAGNGGDTLPLTPAAAPSHLEIRRRRVPGVRLTHDCEGQSTAGINHPCMNWMSFWRDADQYASSTGFDLRAARIAPVPSLEEYEGPYIDRRIGHGAAYAGGGTFNVVARYEVRLAADGGHVARGLVDMRSHYDHQVASMILGMKSGGRRLALTSGNLFVPSLSRFTVVVVDIELVTPKAAKP